MPGDEIDPFEIKGNLSVVSANDPSEFGDGSVDIAGNINFDGALGENTLANGINIKDLKNLTFKEQSAPSIPVSSEHVFYYDAADSKLKSKENSGIITTYQPTTTKGDLVVHNGTTQTRVGIGLDNQVLTAKEISTTGVTWDYVVSGITETIIPNKYLDLYSVSTTTLTVSSFTGIPFTNIRKKDSIYIHNTSINSDQITINETGNYLVLVKSGLKQTSGNSSSLGSTRMVLNGTEIPGTKNFYFLENDSEGYHTTTTVFVLSVTIGDILSIQGRKESGSGDLATSQGGMELVMIKINLNNSDTSEYFNAYNLSSTGLTTSYTDILFNTIRIQDSIYTYSSNKTVQLSESGIYLIFVNLNTSHSSGTITQSRFRLVVDTGAGFTEVPGSIGYIRNDSSPESSHSGCISMVYNAGEANHKLKVQAQIVSGASSVSTIINGCNFTLVKIESTLGQGSEKYFSGYSTNTVAIGESYTDIPIITENIKNSIYSHITNSPEIEFIEAGLYIISAHLNFQRSANSHDYIISRLAQSTNSGDFFEIVGSQSFIYQSNSSTSSRSTGSIVLSHQVSANTKIKLQSIAINDTGKNCTGAKITIFRLNQLLQGEAGLIVFGTEINYIESLPSTVSSSTNFTPKTTLVTEFIPEGVYRLGFMYIWSMEDNEKKFQVQLTIDNNIIYDITNTCTKTEEETTVSGFSEQLLPSGVHSFVLQFRSIEGNPVTLRDCKIETWRLK